MAQPWMASKADLRESRKDRLEGIVRNHVVPRFGKLRIADISNGEVRAWVAEMRAAGEIPGIGPPTCQRAIANDQGSGCRPAYQ